ncbi:MAG: hypothetical protein U0V74_13985 [Chitinophagales bacterium]
MRLFVLVGLQLILLSAFAQKKCSALKVLSATQQHWVSGAPGGRTGEEYKINLLFQKKGAIEIQGLWIGEAEREASTGFFHGKNQILSGDSFYVEHNCTNNDGSCNGKKGTLPFAYKGAALIKYKLNAKVYYLVVKEFRKVEDLRGE